MRYKNIWKNWKKRKKKLKLIALKMHKNCKVKYSICLMKMK